MENQALCRFDPKTLTPFDVTEVPEMGGRALAQWDMSLTGNTMLRYLCGFVGLTFGAILAMRLYDVIFSDMPLTGILLALMCMTVFFIGLCSVGWVMCGRTIRTLQNDYPNLLPEYSNDQLAHDETRVVRKALAWNDRLRDLKNGVCELEEDESGAFLTEREEIAQKLEFLKDVTIAWKALPAPE